MDICIACDKVLRAWSCDSTFSPYGHWISQGSWFDHVKVSELLSSASSCRLCDLIVSSSLPFEFEVGYTSVRDLLSDWPLQSSKISTVRFRFKSSTTDGSLSAIDICMAKGANILGIPTAAWADQGTYLHDTLFSVFNTSQGLLLHYLAAACVPRRP
jgi:hypothetical protein